MGKGRSRSRLGRRDREVQVRTGEGVKGERVRWTSSGGAVWEVRVSGDLEYPWSSDETLVVCTYHNLFLSPTVSPFGPKGEPHSPMSVRSPPTSLGTPSPTQNPVDILEYKLKHTYIYSIYLYKCPYACMRPVICVYIRNKTVDSPGSLLLWRRHYPCGPRT